MTEREAGELLTIREIARKFGVRDHQVRYGAELVDVEPDRRIGNTGLFGPDAIARIRTALVCTRAIQSPELAAARRGRSRKRVAG